MSIRAEIYLDSNALATLCSPARAALNAFLNEGRGFLANPSSSHTHGREAKRALSHARAQVAASLGENSNSDRIIFTSSGTESNQWVVKSVLESRLRLGQAPHWITTEGEHDSIRMLVPWVEKLGGRVSIIPLGTDGTPQIEKLPELIGPQTALLSVIWVNNETGAITDWDRLVKIARQYSVPLHLDGAQAWGKLPIELEKLGAQFVTFSGHKIGGLPGSGVLWCQNEKLALQPDSVLGVHPFLPGKQEKGRRGGTENLFGILAMGAAAAHLDPVAWKASLEPLRDRLEATLCEQISGTRINGKESHRIANTSNLNFDGCEKASLVEALDREGYSVSSGSACASGLTEPSHVLLAMGRTALEAKGALRISLSEQVTWDDLEGFVRALKKIVHQTRNSNAKWN